MRKVSPQVTEGEISRFAAGKIDFVCVHFEVLLRAWVGFVQEILDIIYLMWKFSQFRVIMIVERGNALRFHKKLIYQLLNNQIY